MIARRCGTHVGMMADKTAADGRRHHPHPKRPIAPNAGRRRAHRSLGSADEGDGATGASVTAPIAVAWL